VIYTYIDIVVLCIVKEPPILCITNRDMGGSTWSILYALMVTGKLSLAKLSTLVTGNSSYNRLSVSLANLEWVM